MARRTPEQLTRRTPDQQKLFDEIKTQLTKTKYELKAAIKILESVSGNDSDECAFDIDHAFVLVNGVLVNEVRLDRIARENA